MTYSRTQVCYWYTWDKLWLIFLKQSSVKMLLLVRGCETNGFTNSLLVCTYMLAFQLCAWPSDILSSAIILPLPHSHLTSSPGLGSVLGCVITLSQQSAGFFLIFLSIVSETKFIFHHEWQINPFRLHRLMMHTKLSNDRDVRICTHNDLHSMPAY